MIFGIRPCVLRTSQETGASMAIIACIDMLVVRRNPAKSEREYSRSRCDSERMGPRLYLKIQIQKSILLNAGQMSLKRFGGTHHRKFSR